MTTIEDLEQDVERLRSELCEAEKKLFRARCDAAGVHVGDRVRGTGELFDGVVIEVREITHRERGKPWVAGWRVAKDGTVKPWVVGWRVAKDGTVRAAWLNLLDRWEPAP